MGFEASLFLDQPVPDHLLCTLCNEVFDQPTTACENGHGYCVGCLERARENSHHCPECRRSLFDPAPPNRSLRDVIMGMRIRCENHESIESPGEGGDDEGEGEQPPPSARRRTGEDGASVAVEGGCEWVGTVAEFVEHIETCPHKSARICPLGCGKRLNARDVEQHERSECTYRSVQCEKCGEGIRQVSMRAHLAYVCPEALVNCRYCRAAMTRQELGTLSFREFESPSDYGSSRRPLSGHYLDCPKVPLRCEFYDLGCQAYLPRDDLAAHHAENAQRHAHLVSKGIKDAQEWQKTKFEWSIACSVLAGDKDLIIESPRLFACGLRVFLKLYVTGEKVEVELLASERNGATAVIRNVKVIVSVLDLDESGYTEGVAEALQQGIDESRAWSESNDIVAFEPGRCPFLIPRYNDDGDTVDSIEATRDMLIKHNPFETGPNPRHYCDISSQFEIKSDFSFFHQEG